MAGSKKTPAKGAGKQAPSKKAAKPRSPKPGPRCIRNLLGVQQNLRLHGDREKPYAITLRPRGQRGDAVFVPLACQSDTGFVSGLDRQFEMITETEYKALQSTYPPIGYLGRRPMLPNMTNGDEAPVNVTVVRQQESIASRTEDPYAQAMDQSSNRPERRVGPVGPRIVAMTGGDAGMSSQMGAAPEGGGDNAAISQQIDAQAAKRRPAPKRS